MHLFSISRGWPVQLLTYTKEIPQYIDTSETVH